MCRKKDPDMKVFVNIFERRKLKEDGSFKFSEVCIEVKVLSHIIEFNAESIEEAVMLCKPINILKTLNYKLDAFQYSEINDYLEYNDWIYNMYGRTFEAIQMY